MGELGLDRAKPADADELAEISRRAFHSDVNCGGVGEGGPPGYDSPQWQKFIMGKGKYFKFLLDGKLIGGAIVFPQGRGHFHLGRIFLDPACHRKGLGTKAMRLVMEEFPSAEKWSLETPPWNTRTRAFYLQQGFRIVGETQDDLFLEKP
jgi:ribosomal protein S18 acetylase RimI-like enzyme